MQVLSDEAHDLPIALAELARLREFVDRKSVLVCRTVRSDTIRAAHVFKVLRNFDEIIKVFKHLV